MNRNQFRQLGDIIGKLSLDVDRVISVKFPGLGTQEYIFFKEGHLYARYGGQDVHIDSPDELSLSIEELKEKYKEDDI